MVFVFAPIDTDSTSVIVRGFESEFDSILTNTLIVSGSADAETTLCKQIILRNINSHFE